MQLFTFKKINLSIFLACLLLLITGFFIEYYFYLPPCPLCTLQRICYFFISFSALCSLFFAITYFRKILFLVLNQIFMALGLFIAAWQVWLQRFADHENYSCVGGVIDLIQTYPFLEFLQIIFSGSSECSDASFKILGFTIAEWSLFAFLILTIINIFVIVLIKNRRV